MQKQNYLKPSTEVVEMSAECSVLQASMREVVKANPNYFIDYGGEDDEFI